MKKYFLVVALLGAFSTTRSQSVGIGTTTPTSSAMLDINSTTKGLLIPRMTTAQRNAIALPVNGLMVYDINTNSFWFYNGSTWNTVGGGGGFSLPYNQTVALTTTAFRLFNNEAYNAIEGESTDGYGVSGISTNSIGLKGSSIMHIGIHGSSSQGHGIVGASVNGYALQAISSNSYGIYAGSGTSSAIYAQTSNALATIGGFNLGAGTGVRASSSSGIGIDATSTSGLAIKGVSTSENGILGTSAGAAKSGVRGEATGTNGIGVSGFSAAGTGVSGTSTSGAGIHGTSTNSYGLRGTTSTSSSTAAAVYGENNGTQGNGVLGVANFASGKGVQGSSINGIGVLGYSTNNMGVSGSSISGIALYGNSTTGYGLDVSGKVKIAGGNTNPQSGAVLTSDASGNATWQMPVGQSRIAFRVYGISSFETGGTPNNEIPHNTFKKVEFNTESFDHPGNFLTTGNGVAGPTTSTYIIPKDGVYHFSVTLHPTDNFVFNYVSTAVRLRLDRNGSISTLAEIDLSNNNTLSSSLHLASDFSLLMDDVIWVEYKQQNTSFTSSSLETSGSKCFFTGHLLYEL